MTKSCPTEVMYSSPKCLMTLEECHLKATKKPKRGFEDASYLWVEGIMTFEESQFQASKITNIDSVNVR